MPADSGIAHDHAPAAEGAFSHGGVEAEQGPRGAAGSRWAIVVSRFNGKITDALFRGAVDTLVAAGARPEHIRAVSVPGAVEIPLAAAELAETRHYAGVIALGCVIRGETSHFDYVCSAVTDGVLRVQLDEKVPVGFGLVTCDTVAQAEARAQLTPGGHNVGADAASAALELAGLVRITRSS